MPSFELSVIFIAILATGILILVIAVVWHDRRPLDRIGKTRSTISETEWIGRYFQERSSVEQALALDTITTLARHLEVHPTQERANNNFRDCGELVG